MNNTHKVFFSLLAGIAIGVVASTLISKEERDKISQALKDKASRLKKKLEDELNLVNNEAGQKKNS